MKHYKIIIHTPEENAEEIRTAIGDAGAGKIGPYTHCSFTHKGIGRFKPQEAANPHIGTAGTLEEVPEVAIEVTLTEDLMPTVLQAIYTTHPYEEPALEVLELTDFTQWLKESR